MNRDPNASHPELPPRFRLLRILGTGSSGTVCLAHDSVRNREVALKRFNDLGQDVFREFMAMSKLPPHPALALPLDCRVDEGATWLTMEPAPGHPLRRFMADRSARALIPDILSRVLEGLDALHSRDFLHRDLKPENILVDAEGEQVRSVVLVDLGLARPVRVEGMENAPAAGTLRCGSWRDAPRIARRAPARSSPCSRSPVFDLAVNLGDQTTVTCLQRALRACGIPVKIDGRLGPETCGAAVRADEVALMAALRSKAAGEYHVRVARDAGQDVFRDGWLNRAYA